MWYPWFWVSPEQADSAGSCRMNDWFDPPDVIGWPLDGLVMVAVPPRVAADAGSTPTKARLPTASVVARVRVLRTCLGNRFECMISFPSFTNGASWSDW